MAALPPSAGRLIGTHARPNVSCSSESKAARFEALSILLTTIMRVSECSSAAFIIRRVIVSMPAAASITTNTVSTPARTLSARPMKSEEPGVSIRFKWAPAWSKCTIALSRLCRSSFSRSS